MNRTEITRLIIAPFASNCYILNQKDSKEAVIIDPGGDETTIKDILHQKGLVPSAILLTHGHLDHIMAVAALRSSFEIPTHAHIDEEELLKAAPSQAQMFGLPPVESPIIDHWFKDGDRLKTGGFEFDVIHTPGHSPGGCCFLIDKHLFAGDTLFESSIGRSDLPGGNYEQLIKSIKSRLLVLPDELVVYPGHGEETTIGRERRSNPFLVG